MQVSKQVGVGATHCTVNIVCREISAVQLMTWAVNDARAGV